MCWQARSTDTCGQKNEKLAILQCVQLKTDFHRWHLVSSDIHQCLSHITYQQLYVCSFQMLACVV